MAPKPSLSKLSALVESKPLAPKSQAPVKGGLQTEGLLNSQNGIQQENKKPDWDYIIPICLCSDENCVCVRNTLVNKAERDMKMGHKGKTEGNRKVSPSSRGSVDNDGERTSNRHLTNHNTPHQTLTLDKNLNTDIRPAVRSFSPHRTWSDEANGNMVELEEDDLSSQQTPCLPQPKPTAVRKSSPVPIPRKPRLAVLTRQEKVEVEEKEEETLSQDGRTMNVNDGKGASSLSSSAPANRQMVLLSENRKPSTTPAPPPRKKPFLSAPERGAPTSAPPPKDVEEQDLGWDSGSQEMEVSVDKEDEEVEKEEEAEAEQEAVYTDFTPDPDQPGEPERPPAPVPPRKPQRHSSPMAWMQRNESSEVKEEEKRRSLPTEEAAVRERVMKALPSPPQQRRRDLSPAAAVKPSRSSLNKPRAKSFNAADFLRSDGQKRNSFRKLLDLKLSVKILPKLRVKSPERAETTQEQSVDGSPNISSQRKFSCPLVGVEQNVDGEEFCSEAEQDIYYENVPHYEEISDYENVQVGRAGMSPVPAASPWPDYLYNDEGIYEEQEPYMSIEKNTAQATGYERYNAVALICFFSLKCFFFYLTF